MKRLVLSIAFLSLGVVAFGLTSFFNVFTTTYKVSKDSDLGKASCMVCHVGKKGGKLNPYGADLKAAMKKAGVKKLDASVLKSVEKLNSTGKGGTNIEKIKAGKNPGAS